METYFASLVEKIKAAPVPEVWKFLSLYEKVAGVQYPALGKLVERGGSYVDWEIRNENSKIRIDSNIPRRMLNSIPTDHLIYEMIGWLEDNKRCARPMTT